MKKLICLTIFISQTALATWDDPYRKFDMTKNTPSTQTITIRPSDNVQQACEQENQKRFGKPFNFAVNACTFWDDNKCLIIVPRFASMHTLGHELLHCYQGNWH